MFRFASPLVFLFLIPLAAIIFFKIKQKGSFNIKVSSLSPLDKMPGSLFVKFSKILPVLKILAIVLLIIAAARPQWGDKKIKVLTEGVNIILALDLSNSMKALDFKKEGKIVNRLEAVKSVVSDFIMQRDGDRIGMVVFGSNAFTQLPLTRDYNTISFMLEKLEIGAAGPRTAIGDAIGISLKRLEDIKSKSNIIILLTDGKSNSGEISWEAASDIAAKRNVKIYTIGVGTKGEAPFLVNSLFGERYVYQKVDVDLEALKEIAKKTSASFFAAQDTQSLEKIYDMINNLEKTKVEVKKWVEYKEFYPILVLSSLIILAIYIMLSNTRLLRIP